MFEGMHVYLMTFSEVYDCYLKMNPVLRNLNCAIGLIKCD